MHPACLLLCSRLHASDWKPTQAHLVQVLTNACPINVKNKSTYALQKICAVYALLKNHIFRDYHEKTVMENICGHTLEQECFITCTKV